MKKTFLAIFFFCIFSLNIYGHEEQYIQQFRELARKVDEINQANLDVLLLGYAGQKIMESQLSLLNEKKLNFVKECNALHAAFKQQGIKIHQLPQGLEILSDLRLKTMMKTARFRCIRRQLHARGLIKETEEDIARRWSLLQFSIGDEELRHKDTQKRIKDCIAKIKAYKDDVERVIREEKVQNGEVPVGLHPETHAESMQTAWDTTRKSIIADSNTVSHLSKIFDAMSIEYGIAHEYAVDDPKGAEGLEQELNTLFMEVYRGDEREILLLPHQK